MAHCNTVLTQIRKFIPRHELDALAKVHHSGHSLRTSLHWSQFVGLAMAQLSSRISLRDIVDSLSAPAHHLYHLGSARLTRSNLTRMNEGKPHELYDALLGRVLKRCQGVTPGHG